MAVYGKKFRLIGAVEREDILLLNRLIQAQNFNPRSPIDKQMNNLLHHACFLGKINILDHLAFQLRIGVNSLNGYNK
jgi:hypothetical protein